MIYYWETENSNGAFESSCDNIAAERGKLQNLLVVYRESNTKDGLPFVIVWEKSK